jgi:DNA repair protein RadD
MIQPRPYQRTSIDQLYTWFRANPAGNPLLVLPTGSGKSIILATLIQEALANWPQTRILMLTHVRELIAQNADKLRLVWPAAPLGIHSAGLRSRATFEPIIFAGIQSVHRKAWQLGRFDLILIDEVHLVGNSADGMYRRFLAEARTINPAVRIIGLTATPWRTTSGDLTYGDDALFQAVAHEVLMLDLIRDGYLAPLISKRMATTLDVSGVQTRQGEFIARQLEQAVDREDITQAALDECLAYGADRHKWLVFCTGVAHAEHVAEALRGRGVTTGCVTGTTPAAQRDQLIADFKSGKLRALTNANVLTTGFDVPATDLLVMLRPTQSPGLFVQMVGRGSRIATGKDNCLVLDFAGNTVRHGPVDQVRAWIPSARAATPGAPPTRSCPQCQSILPVAVRQCPECGYDFPVDDTPKHAAHAVDAPILSNQAVTIERHAVHALELQRWPGKDAKPDTLCVSYRGPFMRIAREWVCLEHQGYARTKAVAWWGRFAPGTAVPRTIDEALTRQDELAIPATISVAVGRKYPEITGYEFAPPVTPSHPSLPMENWL